MPEQFDAQRYMTDLLTDATKPPTPAEARQLDRLRQTYRQADIARSRREQLAQQLKNADEEIPRLMGKADGIAEGLIAEEVERRRSTKAPAVPQDATADPAVAPEPTDEERRAKGLAKIPKGTGK